MIIDFDAVGENAIPNFKGGEKEARMSIFFDGMNRIMRGRLSPGASIGMHTHTDSSEIIMVTNGCGCVIYDDARIPVKAGDVHYCPKGHSHSLVNDSDAELEFKAVVPIQ